MLRLFPRKHSDYDFFIFFDVKNCLSRGIVFVVHFAVSAEEHSYESRPTHRPNRLLLARCLLLCLGAMAHRSAVRSFRSFWLRLALGWPITANSRCIGLQRPTVWLQTLTASLRFRWSTFIARSTNHRLAPLSRDRPRWRGFGSNTKIRHYHWTNRIANPQARRVTCEHSCHRQSRM